MAFKSCVRGRLHDRRAQWFLLGKPAAAGPCVHERYFKVTCLPGFGPEVRILCMCHFTLSWNFKEATCVLPMQNQIFFYFEIHLFVKVDLVFYGK